MQVAVVTKGHSSQWSKKIYLFSILLNHSYPKFLSLYLQKNHFYSFCICDGFTRIFGGNKKNILLQFVNVKTLLFSIQYENPNFSCVFQS
jgi:hypothetical protein